MDLLLFLVLILVVVAIFGGAFVHPVVFLVLILALCVLLFRGTRVH